MCEECAVREMRSGSWENRATRRLGSILSKESDDVFQCNDDAFRGSSDRCFLPQKVKSLKSISVSSILPSL